MDKYYIPVAYNEFISKIDFGDLELPKDIEIKPRKTDKKNVTITNCEIEKLEVQIISDKMQNSLKPKFFKTTYNYDSTKAIVEIDYYNFCYLEFRFLYNTKFQNSKILDLSFNKKEYRKQIENYNCDEKCHLRLYYYLKLYDDALIEKAIFNDKTFFID